MYYPLQTLNFWPLKAIHQILENAFSVAKFLHHLRQPPHKPQTDLGLGRRLGQRECGCGNAGSHSGRRKADRRGLAIHSAASAVWLFAAVGAAAATALAAHQLQL